MYGAAPGCRCHGSWPESSTRHIPLWVQTMHRFLSMPETLPIGYLPPSSRTSDIAPLTIHFPGFRSAAPQAVL